MATQLARTDDGGLTQALGSLNNQLSNRTTEFKAALPAHIRPEQFQRIIMTAVTSDPDLLRCDRRSLLNCCMKAAQDGLMPDKREAALVVYNNRKKIDGQWVSVKEVQYMPMVYGLRKKILQSSEIKDIFTAVVYRREYEDGTFYYEEGTDRTLRHKPNLDLSDEDSSDENIIAAYSVATFTDGSQSYEVMRRSEINKVRQASMTGAVGKKDRQGNPIAPKGPWVDWFAEMAKKTVMRRHSKVLPMSGDLVDVEAYDEQLAARSATALLASDTPDAPVALPSRNDEVVDQETGEIGGGEDDEEIQRTLDAQAQADLDGHADEEDGPDQSQQGESHNGTAGAEADPDWNGAFDTFTKLIARKETIRDVESAWTQFQAENEAMPDAVFDAAQEAVNSRTAALRKK